VTASRHQQGREREYIPPMLRRALLPCLLLLATASVASAAGPVAHVSKSCSLTSAQKGGGKPSTLGATYVTTLSASGTSCGKAKGVVKAFNSCRHKHGKAGHCAHVKGYACSEKRVSSPVQYSSSTNCKSGSKRVSFKYSQNT
jgi:hypothetical protein